MAEGQFKAKRRGRPSKPERNGLGIIVSATAGLLLLAGGYLWLLGGTTPPRTTAIGGPFSLTASDGETVTDRNFRGRYVLLYFGYTSCQDVCPVTLSAIADALDVLGAKSTRVQPLFVTVDPQRDTPDVLRRYVANFTPRLLGLTGTPSQIQQMEQSYRVSTTVHRGSTALAGYTMDP